MIAFELACRAEGAPTLIDHHDLLPYLPEETREVFWLETARWRSRRTHSPATTTRSNRGFEHVTRIRNPSLGFIAPSFVGAILFPARPALLPHGMIRLHNQFPPMFRDCHRIHECLIGLLEVGLLIA